MRGEGVGTDPNGKAPSQAFYGGKPCGARCGRQRTPHCCDGLPLLHEFVLASLEMGKRTDDMDIRIVANVRRSLSEVRRNIEEKARNEACKESLVHTAKAAMKIAGFQSDIKRL